MRVKMIQNNNDDDDDDDSVDIGKIGNKKNRINEMLNEKSNCKMKN